MKIMPFHGSLIKSSKVENVSQFLNELKNGFSKEKEKEYYVKTIKPSYFIYQIIKNGLSHHGLIVQNSTHDVLNNNIYKHELIIPNKLDKIKNLISSSGSMIKPIMMFHPPVEELSELLNNQISILSTTISITLEDEIHNIYTINDQEIQERITSIFENQIPESFIADGHHRYEAISQLMVEAEAMKPKETIHMLSAYFSSEMLNVVPINRAFLLPKEITKRNVKSMLKSFGKFKKIKDLLQPVKKYNFLAALGGKYYRVKFKKSIVKKYRSISVPTLTVEILESELNIAFSNLTKEKIEIEYIFGGSELKAEKDKSNSNKMVILLPPIKLKDIMKVARQGRTLPAKSTWFTPKIRSGLIIGKI